MSLLDETVGYFPGTRVPLSRRVVGAFEEMSAYVAAGKSPARFIRERVRRTSRPIAPRIPEETILTPDTELGSSEGEALR